MTDMREAVARAICEVVIRVRRQWDTTPDDLARVLPQAIDDNWHQFAREGDAAIAAARPYIRVAERERCAQVAEQYGPSRPMAVDMSFSTIRGRWEGEQAASTNIAAAIRSLNND